MGIFSGGGATCLVVVVPRTVVVLARGRDGCYFDSSSLSVDPTRRVLSWTDDSSESQWTRDDTGTRQGWALVTRSGEPNLYCAAPPRHYESPTSVRTRTAQLPCRYFLSCISTRWWRFWFRDYLLTGVFGEFTYRTNVSEKLPSYHGRISWKFTFFKQRVRWFANCWTLPKS